MLLALTTSACGTTPAHDPVAAAPGPSLATSTSTSQGTWAVVPMGILSQPLETFWQLFFRAKGTTRWVDRSTSLAIATNGGIVMAPTSALRRSFTVAIRQANLLAYAPLLGLSASGRSWTPLAPLPGLPDAPDVLVINDPGTSYAITGSTGDALMSSSRLTTWRTVTTLSSLRASPAGRACGIQSLTALGEVTGQVVLGATCTREEVAGVLAASASGWRLVGPSVRGLGSASVRVLGLTETGDGLYAVLASTSAGSTTVVAAWTDGGQLRWRVSAPLRLGTADVRSFGATGANGLFVLASGASGPVSLHAEDSPGSPWIELPSPPQGSTTVAMGEDGNMDALVVQNAVISICRGHTHECVRAPVGLLSDWALASGSQRWRRGQVTRVILELGSSS